MRPLRTKLIINNLSTIVAAFAIFGALVTYGLTKLSSSFTKVTQESTEVQKAHFNQIFDQNVKKISGIYQEALERKGRGLIEKDSASILPMVEDNAFNQLGNFLKKNFKDDKELLLTAYFVVEGGEVKAWQVLSRQYPDGLGLPIEYNFKTRSWHGVGPKRKGVQLSDPDLISSLKVDAPSVIRRQIETISASGEPATVEAYDCVIPVYKKGASSKDIAKARARGEAIGYLRYVLSLEQMQQSIQAERQTLNANLEKLSNENTRTYEKTTGIISSSLNQSFVFLGLSAVLVLVFAYALAWMFSERVTKPIKALTKVAQAMAAGEYRQEINIKSDDEIGILSSTFGEMSTAILTRDEEIRRAERQLAEIFEAVPLAILSISDGGIVGEKYSGYSEWILNTNQIAGQKVTELVFGPGLNELNDEAKLAVAQLAEIVGKEQLHYDIARITLPSEIHFPLPKGNTEKERYIGITYQPILHNDIIVRMLLVLEDKTQITQAKLLEKNARLTEDKSITRILQIKRAPELLPVIVREITGLFSRIDTATSARSEEEARMVLHSIKGNARIAGFIFLTELVHALEMKISVLKDEGKSYDWDIVSDAMVGIRNEWDELKNLYDALNPNHKTAVSSLNTLIQLVHLRTAETARQLQKKVDLKVIAAEDFVLSDGQYSILSDCILHLVNNAIAHGIALPEERTRQGKSETGTLSVKLGKNANYILCEIADDGSGINVDKVKAAALKKNIITASQAETMTFKEATQLILNAGITTTETANTISGMGVGLAGVTSKVIKLGGKIEVRGESNMGTLFSLQIPLTES